MFSAILSKLFQNPPSAEERSRKHPRQQRPTSTGTKEQQKNFVWEPSLQPATSGRVSFETDHAALQLFSVSVDRGYTILQKPVPASDLPPGEEFSSYYPVRTCFLHLVTTALCPFSEQFWERCLVCSPPQTAKTVMWLPLIYPLFFWPWYIQISQTNSSHLHRSILFKINTIISEVKNNDLRMSPSVF